LGNLLTPDLPRTFPGPAPDGCTREDLGGTREDLGGTRDDTRRIIRHFGQFENVIMRAIYDAVAVTDLFFGYITTTPT
jgi:hypothetical protein